MIVWIVVVLWRLPPMMLIVATVLVCSSSDTTARAIEFAMVCLPRVGLDLIVKHLVLVLLDTSAMAASMATATLGLSH